MDRDQAIQVVGEYLGAARETMRTADQELEDAFRRRHDDLPRVNQALSQYNRCVAQVVAYENLANSIGIATEVNDYLNR